MTNPTAFEDVDVGDELPPIHLTLTPEQVKRYAEAANMPGGRFMSDELAKAEGLPGQIVPGNFSLALFSRLITDWSPRAKVMRLSATFRGLVHPEQPLTASGVVTEKHSSDQGEFIECDLVIESDAGDRLVTGTATVRLPPQE